MTKTFKRIEKEKDYTPPISYCPNCGNLVQDTDSLVVEYWNAKQNVFFCWCDSCNWMGEITRIFTITSTEIDD